MSRFCRGFILLAAGLAFAAVSVRAVEDPETRYLCFMRTWTPGSPQSHEEVLREIAANFEGHDRNPEVMLGVGTIFSYLNAEPAQLEQSLRELLAASRETGVPVWIKLDGEQWWGARPDLWNWWDPSRPGYDPDNRRNVEWTWWSPDHAMKIAWRNWGRQIRVLPPPNLASPEYRRACHEQMRRLVPIIAEWYEALWDSEKHLFVGLNVGWESSIGTSAYYYPNGNEWLDRPPRRDPSRELVTDDFLSRGMVQQGYAALSTAGLRTEGDITEEDLYEVVRLHLRDLSRAAAELGIPRDRLFTHGVGYREGERLYDAALNEFACPGWSVYTHAGNPEKDEGIMRGVAATDAPYWGAVEWLLLEPMAHDPWREAFRKTLYTEGCRLLCLYNWEMVTDHGGVLRAARRLLLEEHEGGGRE
ncbi:hypothetical protein [Kiritimatiella glycovorans]|uniref:Uncharacterized protein n=1 Tax=Kiritimatiella glycovorans TaxID=1307763 RepID=A0A0G3EK25_9BACT|nr:hypothetical protein [Kiritimatiella glycovorans]AKJ65145.1 hypothetical protein L21SP4_01910 [Kiritimatiella glycovorans]